VFNIEQVLYGFQPDGVNQLLCQPRDCAGLQGMTLDTLESHHAEREMQRRVTIRSTEAYKASPVVAGRERSLRGKVDASTFCYTSFNIL
jgi:hypothetical protein